MIKISTLFKKNPNNLALVINEVDPKNSWVFTDEGVKATRKFNGTACAIINGQIYKRYDVKKGKQIPEFAIPCQEPDLITGHWPHWVLCKYDNPSDKYHLEALSNSGNIIDGTFELVGPKVQGNPEKYEVHKLVKHGSEILNVAVTGSYDFEELRNYLKENDIEGIVWHHPDGRMCKLRKSDFGIKR